MTLADRLRLIARVRRALSLLVIPLVQLLSCGGSSSSPGSEVIYGGSASDEGFEQVYDRLSRATMSARGPVISAPMGGTQLPAEPAPKITWRLPTSTLAPVPAVPRPARTPAIFGLSAAYAHGAPTTGDVFLLELRTSANQTDPVRVFTTLMEWQVDEASWRKLRGARAPVTITIWSAYLNQNVLEEGPFTTGSTVSFTISET